MRIVHLWRDHGTKILGLVQVTVGVLAASVGVFPDHVIKWLLVLSGLLTAWRGYVNSLRHETPRLPPDQP
jgi:hypothetical protein